MGPWRSRRHGPSSTSRRPYAPNGSSCVLLDRAWVQAFANEKPLPELGFTDPDAILAGSGELVRWRLAQIGATPPRSRGCCARSSSDDKGVAVGTSTSTRRPTSAAWSDRVHDRPSRRQQGYATEAATGMWGWAARHGARIRRARSAPTMSRHSALIHRAGFVEVGSQIDEIDGLGRSSRSLPSAESSAGLAVTPRAGTGRRDRRRSGPPWRRPRRRAPAPRPPRAAAPRRQEDRPRCRRRERDECDPALHLGRHDPAAGVRRLEEDPRGDGTVRGMPFATG